MTVEPILHHYDSSPFSEKVRLVFGFKRLRWHAVTVPAMMPKPDLLPLTGGYRRTPVLQIGADIYCDTALIVRLLDRLQPSPPLYPAQHPLAETLAAWCDSTLFWTVVPLVMAPPAIQQLFAGWPPQAMTAFRDDRIAFTDGMRRVLPVDASVQLDVYLARFERQFADDRRFMLGDEPTIADFSLAHNVWFAWRLPAFAERLARHPRLMAWFARMQAFGHGDRVAMTGADALAVAARGASSLQRCEVEPALGFERGEPVSVAALDYGRDPVSGTLAGLTHDEVVVAREDERAGHVQVHFPRIGFTIRRQERTA